MPAMSSLPIDCSVITAYTTIRMLGGMSAASVPAAAMQPELSRTS